MFKTKPGRKPPRDPVDDFHAFHYIRHTCRRLEHLATLGACGGLDLWDKTVLEVGAGIGDHTTFFVDRGCWVVATDAREENVARLERVFKDQPRVRARMLDLDRVDGSMAVQSHGRPAPGGEFDIVYCYGTLY